MNESVLKSSSRCASSRHRDHSWSRGSHHRHQPRARCQQIPHENLRGFQEGHAVRDRDHQGYCRWRPRPNRAWRSYATACRYACRRAIAHGQRRQGHSRSEDHELCRAGHDCGRAAPWLERADSGGRPRQERRIAVPGRSTVCSFAPTSTKNMTGSPEWMARAPYFSDEAVAWSVKRGVSIVGFDFLLWSQTAATWMGRQHASRKLHGAGDPHNAVPHELGRDHQGAIYSNLVAAEDEKCGSVARSRDRARGITI